MSYVQLGSNTRKKRFENTTHNAIFYTLHVISIALIITLFLLPNHQEEIKTQDVKWYKYDEKTQTLHIDASSVILGMKKLRRTLTSHQNKTPTLIVHGSLHSTEIDVEKKVLVNGIGCLTLTTESVDRMPL